MKNRIISAVVASIICVPLFFIGGIAFNIGVYVLALLALKEFIAVKSIKKETPVFIKLVSYIMMTLLILSSNNTTDFSFALDFRVITALFLIYLLPTVLYHDRKIYSIVDAFFFIGSIFFLGAAFHLMVFVRGESLELLAYLFLISIMTDTFAYVTGMLIGRNKLLEEISPKKTVEGYIGGALFGVLTATWFYFVVIDPEASLINITLITLFLSMLGQFGDLVFSAIKRYYGKKDFSNIMPGHGGILDRLDSILFILLGFMFFMTII